MTEEIDLIVSRYFSGEATKKELRKLDSWLSESDENEQYFHQLTELYQLTGQTNALPDIDIEKAWMKFKAYISNAFRHTDTELSPAFKEIAGDSESSSGRNVVYNIFKNITALRAAAAVALLAVASFTVYYFVKPSDTIQLMAAGEQKEVVLSENASVVLSENAEIIYDKKTNHLRMLKGKAAFNVHSQNGESLLVQVNDAYIKDIGTVFTVDATKPDKFVSVEVTEGEVWFYTEKNSGIYLKANQKAVYDAKIKQFKLIEKQIAAVDTPAVELIFNNIPLREAIEIIKTRYKVEIVIDSKDLNEILLNTSFDYNEPIENVLEIIAITIDAKLVKKNNKYILTY